MNDERHPIAQTILERRLTDLVLSYFCRHHRACPISYARTRVAMPTAEVREMAEALRARGLLRIKDDALLPPRAAIGPILKNSG